MISVCRWPGPAVLAGFGGAAVLAGFGGAAVLAGFGGAAGFGGPLCWTVIRPSSLT
jgi:hypothetical protein